MITLWTAFMVGLMGSVHCAGMCGPICMTMPLRPGLRWWGLLQYNLGRIATYAALGAVFGLLGAGIRIAGLQAGISIFAGLLMIIIALLSVDVESKMARWLPLKTITGWVHRQLGLLLRQAEGGWWKMGILNGLLPCGLVYLAIAGALTLGHVGWGSLYLLAFGLGTLPAMMLTGLLGQYLKPNWRRQLRSLYPVLMTGLGLWLIYRGVQFHLPANFQFLQALDGAPMCH